ncbi:hypothetical protein [Rhodoferax sp.]|jgi:hypothetical protein|uniref:hypothetical protein n=1 Tax=Rhodoferax sp. TaxID=50421 RepID=UPI0037849AAC
MGLKTWAVGCALASAALTAQSLSLGKERGAAWIGQPLELLVAVQLDPLETDACAQAEVYHADSRQDPARVRVTLEPGTQADSRTLRINSASPVDEPVVSVYLSVGCGQKTTRKYVLLADFPTSAPAPVAPLVAAPVAPNAVNQTNLPLAERAVPPDDAKASTPAAEAPPAKPLSATDVAAAQATAVPTAPSPALAAPVPRKKDAAPAASAKAAKPTDAGKPRLQLDPLDILSERVLSLEFGPAKPAARDADRIARLQQDVRALLEQAAKNEASLLALQAQLQQSQTQSAPWPTGLVYALAALTLASLAGMAFMWMRRDAPRG